MAAYEVLLLNTAVPQIQAAQSGDTYVVPRDIAFSAALTLSAGTANGVAYLNASKVLTTGSALTFDGTNLGVGSEVGVSPSNGLTRSWGNTKRFAWMSFDSSYYMEINADAANRVINYTVNSGDNTATHIWNLGASGTPTEQMRLTSTGLGIGTSSPSYNLEVAGAVRSTVAIRGNFAGGTDIGHLRYLNANGSIVADMFAQTTNGGASDSAYLAWQTVNSGSLAERMRLDSSGNLGIGTSSPGAKLDVFAGTTNSAVAQLTGNNTGRGLKVSTAQTTFADDTVVLDAQMATYGVLQLATGGTTRATLDSSGNLGLGVTPKTWSVGPAIEVGNYFLKLAGSGTYGAVVLNNAYYNGGWKFAEANWANMYQTLGGVHSWHTSTIAGAAAGDPISFTQAMSLDANGNLLVGTTSAGLSNTNSFTLAPVASGAYIVYNHASGTASGEQYAFFGYNGTKIGDITQNGTTGVLYNITSDYRLKTVAGAVSGHGERIDSLEPVEYTWNADGSSARGFLAHKFQEVYPNSVTGTKDAEDADGNPVYQAMQASTSEVIADLVAEIQSLRARVAQLEQGA